MKKGMFYDMHRCKYVYINNQVGIDEAFPHKVR